MTHAKCFRCDDIIKNADQNEEKEIISFLFPFYEYTFNEHIHATIKKYPFRIPISRVEYPPSGYSGCISAKELYFRYNRISN